MATSVEFIEYVCEQVRSTGDIRYRKMFGEYMIYINEKPLILVCDNTVYVKKLEGIMQKMVDAAVGIPYKGSKEYYILDIDNRAFCEDIIACLDNLTPLPKPKIKKAK